MNTNLVKTFTAYLNTKPDTLTFSIIALRVIIAYFCAVIIIRIAKQRLMGKYTALDLVVLLMLGSLLGSSIISTIPFFLTLSVAFVLIACHWIFCALTFYSNTAGKWLKGRTYVLIENGTINWENLRVSYISENDLMSALRTNAHIIDPLDVKLAILERSGHISVILQESTSCRAEMALEKDTQKVNTEFK
ncbi:DUF421 domain-containing protein [Candidatus Dependentiae bacterium]|nr:DUF421 domain-containing protein [Candidatus Dependentiae bacterium]